MTTYQVKHTCFTLLKHFFSFVGTDLKGKLRGRERSRSGFISRFWWDFYITSSLTKAVISEYRILKIGKDVLFPVQGHKVSVLPFKIYKKYIMAKSLVKKNSLQQNTLVKSRDVYTSLLRAIYEYKYHSLSFLWSHKKVRSSYFTTEYLAYFYFMLFCV